jgi:flagellar biosynthesis protein
MTSQADTAVALHYNEDLPAPMVVASGRGVVAEAIARIARENGVPLVADPDLAASLIELDVNTLIPESLYEVIANLLVFVRGLSADSPPGQAPAETAAP